MTVKVVMLSWISAGTKLCPKAYEEPQVSGMNLPYNRRVSVG